MGGEKPETLLFMQETNIIKKIEKEMSFWLGQMGRAKAGFGTISFEFPFSLHGEHRADLWHPHQCGNLHPSRLLF